MLGSKAIPRRGNKGTESNQEIQREALGLFLVKSRVCSG